ncbi:DUF308 domain-containing protein [Ruminococcaceae bacterium OttesenSCG-928-O06]|nr:DUF308 domain-containing protein [Ruminococcaceae bacterium OttesenSCG-928-O06]
MKIFTIFMGVLLVIVGFVCFFTPGATLLSIGWLVGLMLLIAGVSLIIDYVALHKLGLVTGFDLLLGILTTAMGVLLLVNQPARLFTDVVAIYMLGVWMVASGVIRLVGAVRARKVPGSGWGWFLVLGILMIGLGIYSFLHPAVSALALAWLLGFYIILEGVDLVAFGASLRKVTDADGEKHWVVSG